MGVFNVMCAESGLVIADEARGILLTGVGTEWKPLALPIRGAYDSYGGLEDVVEDPSTRAIAALRKEMSFPYEPGEGVEGMLREMGRGMSEDLWARWGEVQVSLLMVDEGVYRAVIETLQRGARLDVAVSRDRLAQRGFDDLARDLFPAWDLTSRLYARLTSADRKALQEQLIDFAVFLRWGTRLEPIDVLDGGQFSHYEPDGEDDDGATRPHSDAARQKYAGYPLLLDAVDANERHWRDLEELDDDEEDGEDDDEDDEDDEADDDE